MNVLNDEVKRRLDVAFENATIHLMVVGGSRGYGLSSDNSDMDISLLYVPKNESDILGITETVKPNSKIEMTVDNVVYDINAMSVASFLKLLRKGVPQAMETLHTREENILYQSDNRIGLAIKEHGFNLASGPALLGSALGILGSVGYQIYNPLDAPKCKTFGHAVRVGKSVAGFLRSNLREYVVDYTGTPDHGMLMDIKYGKLEKSEVYDIIAELIDELKSLIHKSESVVFDTGHALNFYKTLLI